MLDFVWMKEERLGRALFNLILAIIYIDKIVSISSCCTNQGTVQNVA